MARPQRCRRICMRPEYDSFSPQGDMRGEQIALTLDEFEVVRLIDYEKMTQEECAAQMEISRTTVAEVYERARYKLADFLINGKRLTLGGGNFRFCGGGEDCGRGSCFRESGAAEHNNRKGDKIMIIAVAYEDGKIFQHFGHTEQFRLYETEDKAIKSARTAFTDGQGHGALAEWLSKNRVDALICGGIGGGAVQALQSAGIEIYAGVSGSADEAVGRLLAGELSPNSAANCSHHEHGHNCGSRSCGDDRHGCSGNK